MKEIQNALLFALPNENADSGLDVRMYEVESVHMGQSYTSIIIDGAAYNSIEFDYYVNGKQVDIYRSSAFNPYMGGDGEYIKYMESEDR